jgi:hypothetical protein
MYFGLEAILILKLEIALFDQSPTCMSYLLLINLFDSNYILLIQPVGLIMQKLTIHVLSKFTFRSSPFACSSNEAHGTDCIKERQDSTMNVTDVYN